MNLYDQLKDHLSFPKQRLETSGTFGIAERKIPHTLKAHVWGYNQCLKEFIDFLKSVRVDEEKVASELLLGHKDSKSVKIARAMSSVLCQQNIIGEEKNDKKT